MQRRNYTRIIALIISGCMLAGIAIAIFAAWPLLLPIMLVVAVALYFFIRYSRGKASRPGGRGRRGK